MTTNDDQTTYDDEKVATKIATQVANGHKVVVKKAPPLCSILVPMHVAVFYGL